MGNNLRRLRKARGWTQAELSVRSGVNRVMIAKYETGRGNPTSKTLIKLSEALGVSTDRILRGGQVDASGRAVS